MSMRLGLCALALLAFLVDGCGEEASREEGTGGRTSPPPVAAPQVITEADAGESFALTPGSETRLRLSGEYAWSEPAVDGVAVQLAPVDYFQDPGFSEWTVLAVQPGTATVAARGTPACAGQEGCPDEPLSFQVEITVAP
jgi:hypothetical protein